MQPVRSIALGVLSLQWNAEGNLKTHVLRRRRGPTCVFWEHEWN
nr:MAG TPA: ribonuclease MC1 [Caudoviricetes sp.]